MIGGYTKAPDYCFCIGGTRKFFLEAKKPSVDIRADTSAAYQLRRYAWSAKLPLSILSDFEEFAAYDCRIKPEKGDGAAVARVMFFTYRDYLQRWEEIQSIFSRDAVLKGSFDRYAESTRAKRGTAQVDQAFLVEIEAWREMLAQNLALRNPGLRQRELNYAVQATIDRAIFLRICEDRGIEQYGQLLALLNGANVYARLQDLYRRADERYNSGLFHFQEEKGRLEPPDQLTLALALDDRPLKEIIRRLYYPESPYEFSVLPADILGQVYEQFLGKVIRLTPAHRAVVESKPEVKKAGGVYYTPTYIVDYIVRHTVGKLLEGKTPRQAAKLRILDPACGSGSFLIGAYQYLLDWHRDWYVADGPEKWAGGKAPAVYQAAGGGWRLTTAERKRILLNNIYGVDIDPQAVEVTKLSLLLKVLEGENAQSVATQLRLFQERALPDLAANVKCGNSLIGPEFYEGRQLGLFDEETHHRINAFDWQAEFPQVMGQGGFDALIGNPPYVRIQTMKEWAPLEVEFYRRRYVSASKGNYDIYVVFVEKGLSLLSPNGRLGFILPHKFFNAQYGESLRSLIAQGRHLVEVVHFGYQQVFAGATTYTCLLLLKKGGREQLRFLKVGDLAAWRRTGQATEGAIQAEAVTGADWNFAVGSGAAPLERLHAMPTKLADVAERIAQGIRTSANEVYVLDLVTGDGNLITAHSKQLDRNVVVERGIVRLFLQGREIKPYQVLPSGKVVIIPYRLEGGRTRLIPASELRRTYPHAYSYLLENRAYLEDRERGRMRGSDWHGYVYPKNIDVMSARKILVPDIADRAAFALDDRGEYAYTSGYGITLKDGVAEEMEYVLGLLNSRVLDYYLKSVSTPLRGGFFRCFTQFIEQLPIRRIDFRDAADKARHDRLVALVRGMVALYKQVARSRTAQDKTRLQRQIQATDQQINRLVYELYGLSHEEICAVESAAV